MGFLDQGPGGFDPMTGLFTAGYDPSTGAPLTPPPARGIGSDANAPQPNRNLFQSLGLGTGVVGDILKSSGIGDDGAAWSPQGPTPAPVGPQQAPPPAPVDPNDIQQRLNSLLPGGVKGIGSDQPPIGGLAAPFNVGGGIGSDRSNLPPPPLPTGMDLAGDKPWVPSDFTTTRQAGRDVPTGPLAKMAAAAAPVPPGVGGASPPPADQSFLQKFVTGGKPSGTQGIERFVSAVGAGMANAQGNGKLANALRGFGGATAGSDKKQAQQFNEASTDFNNHIKLLATGSAVDRNAALAELYRQRGNYLTMNGVESKKREAWQTTDYGRMVTADKAADNHYQRELISLDRRANSMTQQEYAAEKQRIVKETEGIRQQKYKDYGIDPTKKAAGATMENPIDTSKMKLGTPAGDKQFDAMVPPGAFFRTPDGVTRMRPPQAPPAVAAQAAQPQWDEQTASE